MYRSLVRQTLHYFSRPHEGVPDRPVRGPAAWRVADLRDTWRMVLSTAAVDEIERALDVVRQSGKALKELTKDDFPLPGLSADIAAWRRVILEGRGFQVIGGVPVTRWSAADVERFFWCFGLHFGLPGAQNPGGDLLGHVLDQKSGEADVSIRAYRTRKNIAFHCDAADAVGLLCLKAAARGGRSRIASSVSVFNVLVAEDPALAARLFEPFLLDTKSEGGLRYFPVPPCRHAGGQLRTFYHADYFREVARHPDVAALDARGAAVLDRYDAIANDPGLCLEMDLEPGDIQLLSNHTIVHGRAAFEDDDDPERRRHLLRLWLSLPRHRDLRTRWLTAKSFGRLVTSLGVERMRQH